MKLSEHLSINEFERSDYALAHSISNIMGSEQIANAKLLCEHVLERVRDNYGKPIVISSGYRSQRLNAAIGGADTSQHTQGKAADIKVSGIQTLHVFRFIVANLDYDQCIFEQDKTVNGNVLREWVHVSYNEGKNRKQALTRIRAGNEKAKYKPYGR